MHQENIDEIKDQFLVPSSQNGGKIEVVQQVHSQFLQSYVQFFGSAYSLPSKPADRYLQAFKSHNISFDTEQYYRLQPEFKITNSSIHYQFLTAEVKIGFFTFGEINIASINAVFPSKLANHEGLGSFGKVFKIFFQEQQLALKTTQLSKSSSVKANNRDLSSKAKLVIKEYCLSKLASALGVGPILCAQMGFDILFYKDCIAYPMEYCQNDKFKQAFLQQSAKLKQKLLLMHSFQFIHMDIKDDNICYSKIKQQFVFIDFGLSAIIAEKVGCKSFTQYFGTVNYCGDEMSALITKQEGGYVDLYHNDIQCLSKVLSEESGNWKKGQSDMNLDYLYQNQEGGWNGYDHYEDTLIASYLKYLVYRLQFQQFEQVFQSSKKLIKNIDLGSIFYFIKGTNFSSRFHAISPQILSSLNHLTIDYEVPIRSQFTVEEDQNYFYSIFTILDNLNKIESKKQSIKLLKSMRERQILLDIAGIEKLDWKIYLRLLMEVIQINVDCSSFQEKLGYCKIAREIFSRMQGLEISTIYSLIDQLYRQRQPAFNDLEITSLTLFCYSLQGKIDTTKIAVFHSIIYNVVLLQLLDLQALGSFYRRIQHLSINFSTKMRMLLKFRTTLQWKTFEVSRTFYSRVNAIDQIADLNRRYEEQSRGYLSEKQAQFLKIANLDYVLKPCKKSMVMMKYIFQQLSSDKYSEFLKNEDFKKQFNIWCICNMIRAEPSIQFKKKLQNTIFQEFNKKQRAFQYFHLQFLFIQTNDGFDEAQSTWIIDLFVKVFKGTEVGKSYCLQVIRQIIYLQKFRFKNYYEFLKNIQAMQIDKINCNSRFGFIFSQTLHRIIQDKRLKSFPADVQSIYVGLNTTGYLHSYEYCYHEYTADQSIIIMLVHFLKQQFYAFFVYSHLQIESILRPKFKKIYAQLSGVVRSFTSKKYMNYALLGLNAIAVYLLFRQQLYSKALELIDYVYSCFDHLCEQDQLQTDLKPQIYRFFLILATTKTIKAHQSSKRECTTIFEKYYKIIKKQSLHRKLLNFHMMLIETFIFLLYDHPQQLPVFINKFSYEILLANSQLQAMIYYTSLEKIFICGHFLGILYRKNKMIIFPQLQDVKINPYNALYLHLSMRINHLWSKRQILQICKSFNLIKKQLAYSIKEAYYKYFLGFFSKQMSLRKIRLLFFLDFKHDYKQWKTNRQYRVDFNTLKVLLSEGQLVAWRQQKNKLRLQSVKAKLTEYFIGVNRRGKHINELEEHDEEFLSNELNKIEQKIKKNLLPKRQR